MPRYIGFLRGINVGGHRVTMDALRRHFSALKFAHVETFIASGNVLFETAASDAAALEISIEKYLARALGYEAPTFLRTPEELAAVVAFRPFAPNDLANDAISRYVLFLRAPLQAARQREVAQLSCATDEFRAQGREIHWLCRGRISDPTPAAKAFEKLLRRDGVDVTSRNIRMLQRLLAENLAPKPGANTRAPAGPARPVTRAGKAAAGRARTA